MAILKLLDQKNKLIKDVNEIKQFMNERGIIFEQWESSKVLHDEDDQETILEAYQHSLSPYMAKYGYNNADVINGYKHWFDLAPKYHVKAIRVFMTKEGWVARYTDSGVEKKYLL